MNHRTSATPPSKLRALPTGLALALLGSFGAISWVGCGGASVASACRAFCDCYECSDAEYEECVENGEAARDSAAEAGCGSEFDDMLDCQVDNLECEDGRPRLVGCETELAAFQRCGADLCDQAFENMRSCGYDIGGGGEADCTDPQTRCSAQCLADASCAQIDSLFRDGDPDGPLMDCFNDCSNVSSPPPPEPDGPGDRN